MSVPNSFNPSDYQYLLKSLVDGNFIAKSQSLKRFNTLVLNDKKQFTVYAKRIILAIQDLMHEQKQDINLLASMLVLEIVNLNPRDIQYYIKTKLLKHVVSNLGDIKPQLRKTSHYCLLAFVRTYKNIQDVIGCYFQVGFNSHEAQLRQKCINSFQSIVITETKCINWNSNQFKRVFQLLLQKLKDQNQYVQKASEQCLLTISRMEEVKGLVKKLSPTYLGLYRLFCEAQKELGNLQEVRLQPHQKTINSQKSLLNVTPSESHRSTQKSNSSQMLISIQKINMIRQESYSKQAIIQRIQEIRKHTQTPRIQQLTHKIAVKKNEEVQQNKPIEKEMHKQKDTSLPHYIREQPKPQQTRHTKHQIHVQIEPSKHKQQPNKVALCVSPPPILFTAKTQKVQNVFGKKLLDDLKNDKDWKVRLQAIQQLQTKFQMYYQALDIESIMKSFVPILVKLLADQNFKIAFIALKIIEQILKLPTIKLEVIVPQVIDKLNDNKIALRQNVSKLIRHEYLSTNHDIWIRSLLQQLRKSTSANIREEVLNIFTKLYQEKPIFFSYQRIIEQVCPLMDDLKTKIKIRTLDLLVLITVTTQKVDHIKTILGNRLNQVYYEMYVEKVGKELKNSRSTPQLTHISHISSQSSLRNRDRQAKSVAFPSLKKNKNSANNTTSSSLQKYSKTIQTKPMTRALSYVQNDKQTQSLIRSHNRLQKIDIFSSRNLTNDHESQIFSQIERGINSTESVRKKPLKNYKKKLQRTLESKLMTNYTTEPESLKPISDPDRQFKNILIDIKSDDWQISFESLTKLRRIIHFNAELLTVGVAKGLVPDIMRHVESLRSSLSKNAVITINQLSNCHKKNLDSELDIIFTKLMRKTLDANSFISQEVKKALISVCSNSNESKVVTLLFAYHNSKALPIKQTIVLILEAITFLPKFYEKQLERMIQIFVSFMGEGSLQIRQKTKTIMNQIIDQEKINSKIYKLIPNEYLQKLKKKEIVSQKVQVPSAIIINKENPEPEAVSQRKKKVQQKITVFPPEFNQFQDLLKKSESNEWKTRLDSLSKLASIVLAFPDQTCQYKLSSKIMDILSKQTNDPNSKVSANALTLLKEIVPVIPRMIEANLSIVINELLNCFAVQKNEIRELSLQLFDIIANNIQKWMLVQHLCSGVLYGAARSKASILVKLMKILPECFRQKKTVVTKNVYGMINKLSQDCKSQVQPILKQIVSMCLSLGGDDAQSLIKQQAKDMVN